MTREHTRRGTGRDHPLTGDGDNTRQKQGRATSSTLQAPAARSSDALMDRIATFREPTEDERSAIAAAEARAPGRPVRLAIKSEEVNGKLAMVSPHSDPWGFVDQLRDTLGSSSDAFCGQLVTRLDPILRDVGSTRATDNQVNAALAVMGAVAPQNELEANIGEQIIGGGAWGLRLGPARIRAGLAVDARSRRQPLVPEPAAVQTTQAR